MVTIGKEQEFLRREHTPRVAEHRQPTNPRIKQSNAHMPISFFASMTFSYYNKFLRL